MGSLLKFLVVSVFLFSLVSGSNGNVASLEVTEAEEALISAYELVLEAEESGANVSSLLDKLNVGGEYLAEANAYVRLGDSESASHFTGLCVEVVGDVEDEAVFLRDEAVRLGEVDFVVTIIGSVVGVVVVLVAGFVVWRAFSLHYRRRVELRSEVVYSES